MGSMRPDIGRVPVDSSAIGNADPAPSMSWILKSIKIRNRAVSVHDRGGKATRVGTSEVCEDLLDPGETFDDVLLAGGVGESEESLSAGSERPSGSYSDVSLHEELLRELLILVF